ncbi:MAG: isoprenylcysteine carboxylmethyltransferase family protein [Calditrichaeota bacterium]|nr:MAG: isoprenylcysteine carboxylmethyltransferase family protein [Calditrichota bacterium]
MSKKLLSWSGVAAVIFFIIIYGVELVPHKGPPVTIIWLRNHFGQKGLILLNILIVLAFLALFPYRKSTRGTWQSRGAFVAFVIALMTEMFGWPLLIFLLSPLIKVPSLRNWAWHILGHTGPVIGTWLSITGVLLIALGWRQIHRARALVTGGIYRFFRHPQYTGIFLFTLGWILHWPSVITLILWPILIAAYVWLAKQEEKQLVDEFGEAYLEYAKRTPRFFPRLWPERNE